MGTPGTFNEEDPLPPHAPGRTDLYFRRKVPEDVRTLFNCGEFYKVPLGTKDPRLAEPKLAIANGEFEQKLAMFRQTLDLGAADRLSDDEAHALVERYLTRRSNSGFASGGLTTAFVLRELDAAVDEIEGTRIPTAQSMSAEDWRAFRQRMTGDDDEFSEETQARLTVEHALRNRPVEGVVRLSVPDAAAPMAATADRGNCRDEARVRPARRHGSRH